MRRQIERAVEEFQEKNPRGTFAERNRADVARALKDKAKREAEAAAWIEEVKARKKAKA